MGNIILLTFFLLHVRIVFLFSFLIFEEIMNTRIIVSAAFVALALAGCGSINNVTVSD
ncbi:hypothetical protein NMB1943 [Neisseria meningitidis MC58]|uniref:Uncharacterized protein n=1 Tax=Neisseria meningitidis serogroup B (strain ATCC BAA-335 / MC58) TaxID=122586 RepID=Q9JXP6_NEIMB|nr:hypothetical protein NMB1943 [Neisseria meningitidis MC58]